MNRDFDDFFYNICQLLTKIDLDHIQTNFPKCHHLDLWTWIEAVFKFVLNVFITVGVQSVDAYCRRGHIFGSPSVLHGAA